MNIDGGGNRHNIKRSLLQILKIGGEEYVATFKILGFKLIAGINPFFHQIYTVRLNVKSDYRNFPGKFQCDGQAHITQAYQGHLFFPA